MAYLDTNSRTTKTLNAEKGQPLGRFASLSGLYIGFVKNAADVQTMGRLQVWIPEFASVPTDEAGWITVNYCSPFAGATNVETISKTDQKSFEQTQTSYGMWFVPPDINNQVLIMFVNGDPSKGIWIGCLFGQFMNNMVPGMAADTNNAQHPGKYIPVAEYNKWDTRITRPDQAVKPYEATKFKGLGNQGLITDTYRGVTDTSARRESPSAVFGILTPGPAIDSTAAAENIRRTGGSSFVMDDGVDTEYIQFATKSGAQIMINESKGFVYIVNRDGTSWVQMDQTGNIDIFGAGDISLRAQRDFNIRADRNINIEAGQNIFMKAAKDTVKTTTNFTYGVNLDASEESIPLWAYVGEGKGEGGDIVIQALNDWHSTAEENAYITVKNADLSIVVNTNMQLTTVTGGQDYSAKMGIKMTTEAAMDLAALSAFRVATGTNYSLTASDGIIMCTPQVVSINGDTGVIINSGTTLDLNAPSGATLVGGLSSAGGATMTGTVLLGGPDTLSPVKPNSPQVANIASSATMAQIKPLNDKTNILATWKDPEDKFKRNAQSVQSTLSRFPTYEPCPEHDHFDSADIAGAAPIITDQDATYVGSSGRGNDQASAPGASTTPGANNSSVTGDTPSDSAVSKDISLSALRCQLVYHENLVKTIYRDSTGLLHGGIGHLLRTNEITQYPTVGTPLTDSQIETWYSQDSTTSIKIAQELAGDAWGNLSEVRRRALVDMAFNLGKPRLSKFVKFLNAVKIQDWQTAGRELVDSVWYGQVYGRGGDIVSMIVNNVDPSGCTLK
jgi:lysozyme